jgi:hypothetical protein
MNVVDFSFPDVLENGVEFLVERVGGGIVEVCTHYLILLKCMGFVYKIGVFLFAKVSLGCPVSKVSEGIHGFKSLSCKFTIFSNFSW